MIVRFATTCDVEKLAERMKGHPVTVICGARSEEYSSFPMCEDCGGHVCPDCEEPGTREDADLDRHASTVCKPCMRERLQGGAND